MTEEQYAVVTRTTEPGKVPQVRVYGPYPSRKVAQRKARRRIADERIMASLGRFTAAAHKILDDKPQYVLIGATVQAIEVVDDGIDKLMPQGVIPGSRTVPPGSRTWDAGPSIGVYSEAGHWIGTVSFKHRWQATLFHALVNRSTTHNGTREA